MVRGLRVVVCVFLSVSLSLVSCGGCAVFGGRPGSRPGGGSGGGSGRAADRPGGRSVSATTPVQEYVGQGYDAEASQAHRRLVREHEGEIRGRAVAFMRERWHVDVRVSAVWAGTDHGVGVYMVCDEPRFVTHLGMTLDGRGHVVGEPFTSEGAIVTGLLYRAYRGEYDALNAFLEGEARRLYLYGMRQEAIERTQGVGYETPWLFISTTDSDFPDVLAAFERGEDLPAERIRAMFEADVAAGVRHLREIGGNPERGEVVSTSIQLYSSTDDLPPRSVVDTIEADLKEWGRGHAAPPTGYTIDISRNFIVDRAGQPNGDTVDTGFIKNKEGGGGRVRFFYLGGQGEGA